MCGQSWICAQTHEKFLNQTLRRGGTGGDRNADLFIMRCGAAAFPGASPPSFQKMLAAGAAQLALLPFTERLAAPAGTIGVLATPSALCEGAACPPFSSCTPPWKVSTQPAAFWRCAAAFAAGLPPMPAPVGATHPHGWNTTGTCRFSHLWSGCVPFNMDYLHSVATLGTAAVTMMPEVMAWQQLPVHAATPRSDGYTVIRRCRLNELRCGHGSHGIDDVQPVAPPLDLCCCACTAGTGSSGNPLNSWQDFGWLLLPTDMCTSTAAAAATCRRAEVWSTCVAALPSGCCASAVPAHMHTGPSHGGSRAHTHTGGAASWRSPRTHARTARCHPLAQQLPYSQKWHKNNTTIWGRSAAERGPKLCTPN